MDESKRNKQPAAMNYKSMSVALLLVFFLSGCAYLSSESSSRTRKIPEGFLGLYVHFYSPAHEEISFTIKDIQAVCADGTITMRPIDQTLEAGSDWRQVLIEAKLPPGSYQRVGLSFTRAVLHRAESDILLEYPENQNYAFLDLPFLITPQRTTNAYVNLAVKSQSKGDVADRSQLNVEELEGAAKSAPGVEAASGSASTAIDSQAVSLGRLNADAGLLFSPRLSQGKKPAGLKSLMLYVTNTADNTVSVLDRLTDSLISVIQVGKSPKGIVVNPTGTYAYVANCGSNTVSIIDTMTNELEDTIDLPLGLAPSNMAMSSDGKYLFTANTDSDNASMIDTDLKKTIDTFSVGHKPVDLGVSPSGKWLYVTNQGSHDVYVIGIEGRQLADRIPVQSEPAGIAVGGDGFSQDRIFVANASSSSISVFDIDLDALKSQGKAAPAQILPAHSVKKFSTLQGEYGPARIVLDGAGGRLYVTNQKDNSVSSFMISRFSESANIQESRYPVGQRPMGLALDSARNYLYAVNNAEGSISVIDLRQERMVESIKVGSEPFGIDGIDLIRK